VSTATSHPATSCCAERTTVLDPDGSAGRGEVQFAHWPILDLGVPSISELEVALEDLERRVLKGIIAT
jgi:hypothetical protein